MSFTQTEKKLAEITDEGLFEKLATAVLRAAEPEYQALAHPGVNVDGQTVKSPVDAISFRTGTDPAHLYFVHHTITARDGLAKKWLFDPATAPPRRGRRRAATPEGDLVKVAKIVAQERGRTPQAAATLVLTTNQEPDHQTVLDVGAAAAPTGIKIDLWPRSRLAQFLDTKGDGQFLRHQYLKIDATLLSRDLLRELSENSLRIRPVRDPPDVYVPRELDERLAAATWRASATFVVAASGLGKSVACRKQLVTHLQAQGVGLILTQENIAAALSLPDAIEHALRQLSPTLAPGSGTAALALSSPGEPLLLIVDDIHRSGQAALLAERIEGWLRVKDSTTPSTLPGYRLLCPLRPELLISLDERSRWAIEALSVFGSPFTPLEGRRAVQRFAAAHGLPVSEMTADAVSAALGHDPLLIALHDPAKSATPSAVIGHFVERALGRVAQSHQDFAASDYRKALQVYAGAALKRRTLNPGWTEVAGWSELTASDRACLNHLLHDREVLNLSGPSNAERVEYRHDRVRDWLLTDAADALVTSGSLPAEILGDPYFAEVFGAVLARRTSDGTLLARVRAENPLALFHALQCMPHAPAAPRAAVVTAIEDWLASPQTREARHRYLRLEALAALAQTDGPDVLQLVSRFSEQGWSPWQAKLRNGDLIGGIALCATVEPGTNAPWRDVQITHAKHVFSNKLVAKLGDLLEQATLNGAMRSGAVRLAGHIADPALAELLDRCWAADAERLKHLDDYLWAFAECCGTDAERYLSPICDAWAALPSSDASGTLPSPREELAAHHVRWAFQRWVPRAAIPYFVKRAQEQEDLRWPITYMLSEIDDPVAVQFVVREMAAMERRLEGADSFSPFAHSLPSHWARRQEEHGVGMSSASRDPLQNLWTNLNTEKHLRKAAFRLWAATETEGDLALLKRPYAPPEFAANVLQERLLRRDRTALPLLLEKLQQGGRQTRGWWGMLKYVWSDDLLGLLDPELARRSQGGDSEAESNTDEATADLMMRLSPETGEALLLKYWTGLKHRPIFVQVALFLATPALQDRVREVINSSPEPKQLLRHLGLRLGLNMKGHPGITREVQIEALLPYLAYLARHDVLRLRDLCNQQGWFSLRRASLDPFLRQTEAVLYEDEEPTFAALDQMIEKEREHWLDLWLDDYVKTGATPDAIVARFRAWYAKRRSVAALRLVHGMLFHIGRRPDLQILDEVEVDPPDPAADAIRADATYTVRRRSLY
jgi:hypothetical protein